MTKFIKGDIVRFKNNIKTDNEELEKQFIEMLNKLFD